LEDGTVTDFAPEYVAARAVLLDALEALGSHLENVVLVGAQAVYHHTGATTLNVPVMTTDADLALDTRLLSDEPEIGASLRNAGFAPGANPGHWIGAGDVAVDLMVVPYQANTQKRSARSARIPPHEAKTARITPGLEPALVDCQRAGIGALSPGDNRRFTIRVAGPAALLVAKAIKLNERLAHVDHRPDRVKEKDALDAFRILQAVETEELITGFRSHLADEHAARSSKLGIDILRTHATSIGGQLPQLAARAAMDDPVVAPSFVILTQALLAIMDGMAT
jgi:hypothetical protein